MSKYYIPHKIFWLEHKRYKTIKFSSNGSIRNKTAIVHPLEDCYVSKDGDIILPIYNYYEYKPLFINLSKDYYELFNKPYPIPLYKFKKATFLK